MRSMVPQKSLQEFIHEEIIVESQEGLGPAAMEPPVHRPLFLARDGRLV